MRTYLVTGGAGFIGSNYIHYMFKKYGDSIQIINRSLETYQIRNPIKHIWEKSHYNQ